MSAPDYPAWSFPVNWVEGILETLEWKTDVLISEVGTEQRISRRLIPRRSFELAFMIQGEARQYLQNLLAVYQSALWRIPIWQQGTHLAISAPVGSDRLFFDTRWREFVVGEFVIVFAGDPQVFDVRAIQAITDDSLKLISVTGHAWDKRTAFIYPTTLARLEDQIATTKKLDNLIVLRTRFTVWPGATYPTTWDTPTYNGKPWITERPNDVQDLTQEYRRLLDIVDNELGVPTRSGSLTDTRRELKYRWTLRNREEKHQARTMLYALRGKTRSAWLPTFMTDASLASNVTSGATTVSIKGTAYTGETPPQWRYLHIELIDGTKMQCKVLSSVLAGATETLTLFAPLSLGFTVAQVRSISFLVLARLNQDSVELLYETDTDGPGVLTTAWIELPGTEAAENVVIVVPGVLELLPSAGYNDIWLETLYLVPSEGGVGADSETSFGWVYAHDEGVFVHGMYVQDPPGTYVHKLGRFSAVDLSYLGNINLSALTYPEYDTDVYSALDLRDGTMWMADPYGPRLMCINKTAWSVAQFAISPVSVPAPFQASLGTATVALYSLQKLVRNPFNDNLYGSDSDKTAVFFRINKATGQPAQTLYFCGPNFDGTSPHAGVVEIVDTALQLGQLVFVSATDAYGTDFRSSRLASLFHINLTTGAVRYQFTRRNASGEVTQHRPVHYNVADNTLWLFGDATNENADFAPIPAHYPHTLLAWLVGSHPDTIVEYPVSWHAELMPGGMNGTQTPVVRVGECVVDNFRNGFWIGYTLFASRSLDEAMLQARFFSIATRAFADETRNALPLTNGLYTHSPGSIIPTNAGTLWTLGAIRLDNVNDTAVGYKYTPVNERKLHEARYVRLSLWGGVYVAAGHTGNLGLQRAYVRSSAGGVNVALSVTTGSSEIGRDVANLLTPELLGIENSWVSASATYPQQVVFDLGSDLPVYEIALWPVNSRTPASTPSLFPAQNEAYGLSIVPSAVGIELSLDGVAWLEVAAYQGVTGWVIGVDVTVDPSAARVFPVY